MRRVHRVTRDLIDVHEDVLGERERSWHEGGRGSRATRRTRITLGALRPRDALETHCARQPLHALQPLRTGTTRCAGGTGCSGCSGCAFGARRALRTDRPLLVPSERGLFLIALAGAAHDAQRAIRAHTALNDGRRGHGSRISGKYRRNREQQRPAYEHSTQTLFHRVTPKNGGVGFGAVRTLSAPRPGADHIRSASQ